MNEEEQTPNERTAMVFGLMQEEMDRLKAERRQQAQARADRINTIMIGMMGDSTGVTVAQ